MDPILVVGAGPVGLSLALGLVRQGVEVVVVDQRPGIPRDPRATTLQPPVLEAFADWGVLRAIQRDGRVIGDLQYWDWTSHTRLAAFDYGALEADTPCPYRVHLDQAGICQVLLEAIEAAAPGTVRWGHKAVGLEVHDDHVQLTTSARVPGSRDEHVAVLRGRWLCGADGNHSWTRRQLGIGWEGPSRRETFLTARLDREALRDLAVAGGERLAGVSYLFLRDDWAMVMDMPDHVRLLFRASGDGDEEVGRQAMEERSLELLGDAHRHLHALGLYHVQLRLASQLVKGRVVLLGDAAHAAYPVGGTAMNAGIMDAHHLSWALTHDVSGSDVADSVARYDSTRRAWALRYLLGETREAVDSLDAHWPWTRLFRNVALRRLDDTPEARRAHLLRLSMLGDRTGTS